MERRTRRERVTLGPRLIVLVALFAAQTASLHGADQWVEIKTLNTTVLANGSTGEARRLAWQLEQVRAAIVHVLPWARVDLEQPLVVFAVNNQSKMRALVPSSFEKSQDAQLVSILISGADQHYVAIRSDLKAEDKRDINPHMNAYFAYIALVMSHSVDREMPIWFTRGLAAVLSNTIVRDTELRVGAVIPWHISELRERPRLPLADFVARTGESDLDDLVRFDAHAWAFVHFLLFADNAARAPQINKFFVQVQNGVPAAAAMTESFGPVGQLEAAFVRYVNQSIFSFARLPADASIKREAFPERVLSPQEAASSLGLFHVAMRRPVEARAAIAEARKSGAPAPDSYLAEAMLLGREDKPDDARTAMARAVAEGSTNAHAYIELAWMQWQATPDSAALAEREKLLMRAIVLNPRSARALAWLGDTRSLRGAADGLQYVARAIKLAPSDANYRLMGAEILRRQGLHAEALKAVKAAMTLATTDEQRRRARELQEWLERQKPQRW